MTLKRPSGYIEPDRPVIAETKKMTSACADPKYEKEYPERTNRPFSLELIDADGALWELSWGSYYGANFKKVADPGGNGEKLDKVILQYVKYEVILTGLNLRRYRQGFHDGTLEQLRITESEYEKTLLSRNEPVIKSMHVTTHGIT